MKTLALAIAATALTATVASASSIGQFDSNGDRFASFAEVTAVNPKIGRSDFRDLDTNRDGRLSATEVQAPGAQGILKRGTGGTAVRDTISISGGRFVSEAELRLAYPGLTAIDFDQIDINRDNRLSAVELYSANAQSVISRYDSGSSILVTLDSVDADGSGFASLSELQTQYPRLSENDFRWIDKNRDNRVSFNELYDLDAIEVLGKNR